MSIFNLNGDAIATVYELDGDVASSIYDINGTLIDGSDPEVDYSHYSYTQKWASKGISNTQGFDIYDGKVFWISKSGNASVDANCYVWNLSDGSQALSTLYVTAYTGHGNNLCFDYPLLYATSAYTPHVYVNSVSSDYTTFTLLRTLYLNDGSIDVDVCIDETDSTILWSIGHTANSSDTTAPYNISKWDLTQLTDNGDGTFTPRRISTIQIPQPANSFYYQGCKFHDGILWYVNGYSGSSSYAYVFGVDPSIGETLYSINCETTAEPEGLAWVEESGVKGGYALYVGFAGMALRRYVFTKWK